MAKGSSENRPASSSSPGTAAPGKLKVKGRRLTGEVRLVEKLEQVERERMLELMNLSYDDVRPQRFARDLEQKQWVLLLSCNASGVIQGFSTAMSIDTELDDRQLRALYSGDTVIHDDFWGERTIGKLWLRFVLDQYQHREGRELYWFLISMGHRTYRLLRIFFKTHWPNYQRETPSFEQRLLDQLGRLCFSEDFDKSKGIITRKEKCESMRPALAKINPGRLRDPDIAYFLKRNPGYVRGDELICLAELSPANIQPKAWRLFELGTPDQYQSD